VHEVSDSTDAQKKFGDAKSISSDQYFGGRDPDVSVCALSHSVVLFLTVKLVNTRECCRILFFKCYHSQLLTFHFTDLILPSLDWTRLSSDDFLWIKR